MNRFLAFIWSTLCFAFLVCSSASAQAVPAPAVSHNPSQNILSQLVDTPAVSGYESELGKAIRTDLAAFHPATDNMGNVTITMGAGSPNRLIVTPSALTRPSAASPPTAICAYSACPNSVCLRFSTNSTPRNP